MIREEKRIWRGSHRAASKAWMIPAQDRVSSCNTGLKGLGPHGLQPQPPRRGSRTQGALIIPQLEAAEGRCVVVGRRAIRFGNTVQGEGCRVSKANGA